MSRTKDFSRAPRLLLAAVFALAACVALLPTGAEAKKQKNKKTQQPTTGRIEVSTQPGGYPITIDGQPAGETTDYVRAIELEPGTHTVEIQFPNNTRWKQIFNIIAGRKNCIALNYRPRTIRHPGHPRLALPVPGQRHRARAGRRRRHHHLHGRRRLSGPLGAQLHLDGEPARGAHPFGRGHADHHGGLFGARQQARHGHPRRG